MEIRGVPFGDFARIVAHVSGQKYGNNITINRDGHALSTNATRARLVARDSRGPGARRTWTGRHGPYACWHAYRDALAAIFREYPQAKVRTAMANYIGRAGFEDLYPGTARANIGSQMQPTYMPDLCVYHLDARDDSGHEEYAGPVTLQPPRDDHVNYDTDYDTRDTGRMVADIDAVLAEVAAEGWTSPYTDPHSPALALA